MKLIGYLVLLVSFLYWSYQLLFTPSHWIFLDYANLIVHETGHLLFILFPPTIMLLAGSFFQILIPIIAFGYFLLTKQRLASIFSLFWVGNNFINVSYYIKDAQDMRLPLAFGATIHDWNTILTTFNLLKYDWLIGNFVFGLGILFLLISIYWLLHESVKQFISTNG